MKHINIEYILRKVHIFLYKIIILIDKCIFADSVVRGSLIGLALTQILGIIGHIQYGMRQLSEVINELTGVERVLQYITIETEGPFDIPKSKFPY